MVNDRSTPSELDLSAVSERMLRNFVVARIHCELSQVIERGLFI